MNFVTTNGFKNHRREDWQCTSCKNIVYSPKIICMCGQTKWNSKQFTNDKYIWRIGDKKCGCCNQWNFKSNVKCKFCQADL